MFVFIQVVKHLCIYKHKNIFDPISELVGFRRNFSKVVCTFSKITNVDTEIGLLIPHSNSCNQVM